MLRRRRGSGPDAAAFTGSGELIAGINVLEVTSREEAIAWMKRCPTLQGPSIEVESEIGPVIEALA